MFAYLYFISLTIFKKKQVKLCQKFWNYAEKKRKESIVETFKKGKREKGYWALKIFRKLLRVCAYRKVGRFK